MAKKKKRRLPAMSKRALEACAVTAALALQCGAFGERRRRGESWASAVVRVACKFAHAVAREHGREFPETLPRCVFNYASAFEDEMTKKGTP